VVRKKNMGVGNVNPYEQNDQSPPAPPTEAPQAPAPTPPVESTETPPQEPAPTDAGTLPPPENHDDTDVEAALLRKTQDGKGPDPVPESDFDSFATEGVEEEHLSDQDVAEQVLVGKWGAGEEKRERLRARGYDPSAIARLVNFRLASGAPTVFPTSLRDDAAAVIRGEWGSDEAEIKRNLDHAGKNPQHVWEERNRQLGM
jgi:hypothetical protein